MTKFVVTRFSGSQIAAPQMKSDDLLGHSKLGIYAEGVPSCSPGLRRFAATLGGRRCNLFRVDAWVWRSPRVAAKRGNPGL